jgi:predicted transcriptional regulator
VSCLRDGQKTIYELFKMSRLNYGTVQKFVDMLVKDGTVVRRWDNDDYCRKYLRMRSMEKTANRRPLPST